MKRVLSLLLIFFIIFNIMAPSMGATNMYKASISESLGSTVLDTGSHEEGEEVTLTVSSKEDFYLSYHTGYTLLKNGKLKEFSDKNRIISEKILVDNNSIYHFKNLSAKYGNCFYVIYNSNNEPISYLRATEESTGEVIENINVIMPENASYFRVACDLNVNNKMFEASKSYTKSNGKRAEPAIISFIDDDCREEVCKELYPLLKEIEKELGVEIPYTLACPPGNLIEEEDGDGEIPCPPDNLEDKKYMTTKQLKELYKNKEDGIDIDIVSHHFTETKMTDFDSIDAYEEDTKACLEKFQNMGIEVSGVAYPNGAINDDNISVVEENFKLGFTTDRGINTLPYESYYIDRCELLPTSGIYDIDYAKTLVDSVAENGGWLVFMTHCWYDTFPKISKLNDENVEESEKLAELEKIEKFKGLFEYIIKEKNIEISNVTDVIENYANPIDIGIVKKPLTDMSEDFFIIDCKGRAYTNNVAMTNLETNNMTIIEKSSIKWEEESIDYGTELTLSSSGKVKGHSSDSEQRSKEEEISQKKRNVSDKIYVTPNDTYKLVNMSAKYGNCFYVIYDSDNKVISYQGTSDSSIGETLDEIIITMPSNASYFRMACDLKVNNKMFKAYRASIKGDNELIWEGLNQKLLTEELDLSYNNSGHTLLKNGKIKDFSDQNRIISEEIQVDKDRIYHFKNLSAKYGNCMCVIYNSNNEVISYLRTNEESTGEVIENIRVIMPENAAYFRVACDLGVNSKMFEVYRVSIKKYETINFDANKGTCTVSSIDTDGKIETLPVATREGYKFLGWYTEKTGGKNITTETVFKTSITVYAHWEKSNKSLLGDINGDGKVNINDLNRIYEYINKADKL